MTRRLPIAALASIPALLLSGCGGSEAPPCVASTEICDGIDNNCDGRIDEGFDVGAACTVGVGACQRTGVKVCAPGGLGTVCNVAAGSPTAETCNGIDDDCNGLVDDGLVDCCTPADTRSCGVNQGVCTLGTQTCLSTRAWGTCLDGLGQPVVLPGQNAETCNGIDDNCDGQVDEGDPGGGASCNTGLLGVCAAGTVHCQSGALKCVQNVQPSAEICDGLDNNCDGQVDEGNPGGGVACDTGKLGVCAAGTTHCQSGALACVQNLQPSAEVCDGLDNDCDGVVDNGDPGGGASCNTGLLGVCAAGTLHCIGGAVSCLQNVQPSAELCDGLDNNCNGQVDEGFNLGLACTAGVGACQRSGVMVCAAGGATSVCSATPGSPTAEVCNGIDDDCNGLVDDAPVATMCPLTANVATTTCNGAGGCAVLTCQPGWKDTNGIYADGCESPI